MKDHVLFEAEINNKNVMLFINQFKKLSELISWKNCATSTKLDNNLT